MVSLIVCERERAKERESLCICFLSVHVTFIVTFDNDKNTFSRHLSATFQKALQQTAFRVSKDNRIVSEVSYMLTVFFLRTLRSS